MIVTIKNNGISLKITEDATSRVILKYQIQEVEIIRDSIIKIDTGQGTLNNYYIDRNNVITPTSVSTEDLRDQIIAMLQSNISGTASEAKQIEEIAEIKVLQTAVNDLKTTIASLNDKLFFEPKLVDESNPNTIYNGYAMPGSLVTNPVWAIQKVTKINEVSSYQWAQGNRNFDKIWNNRTLLIYS